MAFQIKRNTVLRTFLCFFLSISMTIQGIETDVFCLKSIKDSLEDPFNYLQSWNFNNNTEGFTCSFNGVECDGENRVLNLSLSNMRLKGQFPQGLVNCSSITVLDLSFNELSGPIPPDISLKFITTIDLSNNKFTGEIPQELGLLSSLKTISVANNHFSGPVPVFTGEVDFNYDNNRGLCGGPLGPCSEFLHSFKDGLIPGYVFSLICSVTLTCMFYSNFACCVQLEKKKKKKKKNHQNKAKELWKYICSITSRRTRMVASQMHELLHPKLVEEGSKEISALLEGLTSTIWFEELNDATDCFAIDNAIGVGKMGFMYQGCLSNGQFLAVKRLFDSRLFKRQFLSEVMILGRNKHRNIVPLLGFCIEGKEKLLTYTYMSNGRLSRWLHPLESETNRLKWPERVNIARGIARGLSWLHHNSNLHVVHFNICSQCILLDDNFEPKISNFGEAKFMNLDNFEDDLGMIFEVNDGKKDVYDFGSILFELITGKTYNELSCSFSTTDLCSNPSNFYNAIDKSLIGEGFQNEVCTLLKIACECVHHLPDQRPTMLEVYNNMSNVKKKRHGSSDDSHTSRGSEIIPAIGTDEIVEL